MNNPDLIADQTLFHTTFRGPAPTTPVIPSSEDQVVAYNLIYEEYKEFSVAWDHCARIAKLATVSDDERAVHLASLLDALIDEIYVCIQAANLYGLPLAEGWELVQQANMSKLWTEEEVRTLYVRNDNPYSDDQFLPEFTNWTVTPSLVDNPRYLIVKDERRKVRKPPSWQAPDVVGLIRNKLQLPAMPSPKE